MNKTFDRDRENPSTILPLTSAQEAIYVAHLLDNSEISFNIAHYREINGEIDADLLSKAIGLVVEKTPAYRSVVKLIDETPFIEVKSSPGWGLTNLDFSKELDPEKAAKSWINQEQKKPFDLSQGPLFKFVLIKLDPTHHYIFYSPYHIIVDGAGGYQFERNVFETYASLIVGGKGEAPEGPDKALELEDNYLASSQYEIDKAFWREELAGVETPHSLSARLPVSGRLFHRDRSVLTVKQTEAIQKYCSKNKVSVSRLFLALTGLYYARMTGQSEIVI